MALDVTDDDLIAVIGHDGGFIFRDYPEPCNRRGFHISELIIAARQLGYSVTPIERCPSWYYREGDNVIRRSFNDNIDYFNSTITTTSGVITGDNSKGGHAVAYERGRLFDPDGFECAYGEQSFIPRYAWIVEPRGQLGVA